MLSSLNINNGVLSYLANSSGLTVSTTGPGGTYTFADNQPIVLFPGAVSAGWTTSGDTATGPTNSVSSIQLTSNATNDTFSIDSVAAPTSINSGAGNDTFNMTADGIPLADPVTVDNTTTNGSDSDTFNIDTAGTPGTFATGQFGRESYQAAGQGLINITTVKPGFADSLLGLVAGALTLDLNTLYTTPTSLTTTLSVSAPGALGVNISGNGSRQFAIAALASVSVGGTTAGESLTVDYSQGDPLPNSGLTYDPPAAASNATNSLTLQGGSFTSEVYTGTGPGAGTIDYNASKTITFSNLSPMTDTVASPTFVFDAPATSQSVNLVDGPIVAGAQTDELNDGGTGSFELADFANKTAVTVNVPSAGATTDVDNDTPAAGLVAQNINSGAGNETINVQATPSGVTTTTDTGSAAGSTTNVGSGGLLSDISGPVFVKSTGGSNTLAIDDSGEGSGQNYNIVGSQVTASTFPSFIDFSGGGITTLDVTSAGIGDTFDFSGPVQSAVTTYNFSADSGPGPNTLNVTSSVPTLDYATPGVITFGAGEPLVNYVNFQAINVTKPASQPVGTATTITTTEGQTLSNVVVASFAESDLGNMVGDFTASINWGDGGASSIGTIVLNGANSYNILGSHTYAEAGTYTVNVTLTDLGSTGTTTVAGTTIDVTSTGPVTSIPNPILSTAQVADAPITASGTSISGIEGNSTGSVVIATFSDANPGATVADFTSGNGSVVVSWGDGTAPKTLPAADITASGSPDGVLFTVTAAHTYLEEGHFQLTVTITDTDGSKASANGSATIADAPLSAGVGLAVSGTEGANTGVVPVATFADGSPSGSAADFTATIDWGDGSLTTGTVVATGVSGGLAHYEVTDQHTYLEEGSYPIKVTINDVGGSTLSVTGGAATIADAALVSPTAIPVAAVEGLPFSLVPLGTFTDDDPDATAADFKGTINWGDGSPTSSAFFALASDATFLVSGSHTYTSAGPFTITVAISDVGGSTNTITSSATVADASLVAAGATVTGIEGNSTGSVLTAVFTDADPTAVVGDFTATIGWGDGTSSAGVVSQPNGPGTPFFVDGTHTYLEEGTYATTITVKDAGGTVAVATGAATIADAPLSAGVGLAVSGTEGANTGIVPVATFADGNPTGSAADFTATIDWGNGVLTTGSVVATGVAGGLAGYEVMGGNTYLEEGSYPIKVTINDVGGSTLSVTGGAATIADAALVSPTGAQVAAVEGLPLIGAPLGTFTDNNPFATSADFSVAIDWGDGTPTTAGVVTLVGGSAGGATFQVSGSHTYAEEGSYPITAIVTDVGGSTTTIATAATVADAPLSSAGATITGIEGNSTGSVTVASFTDANPAGTAGDYTAMIDWGDGTALSAGTITPIGAVNGVTFAVNGSHVYVEEGTYAVTVTITDAGGATTVAHGQATIADAPLTTGAGVAVSGTEGAGLVAVPVFTFSDTNPLGNASDFTATIDWGDNVTSTGTVTLVSVAGGVANYRVTGNHTYTDEGSFPINVLVKDVGGEQIAGTTTAAIADAALGTPTGVPVSSVEGQTLSDVLVGTFVDANKYATAGDFSATITWGDSSTSPGYVTVVGGGAAGVTFAVTGNHIYKEEGSFPIGVTVNDVGGSTTAIATTATVADAPLTAVGTTIIGIEGLSTGTVLVGTFSDANSYASLSDFTATIDWGDGTSPAAGTIASVGSGNGVTYNVTGVHTYAETGTYPVTVTIVDKGGSQTSANSHAAIADAALTPAPTQPTVNATEGRPVAAVITSGPSALVHVATFIDANPTGSVSDFTAIIDWGDGTPRSTGIISQPGGVGTPFWVSGNHTYANALVSSGTGHFPITVNVTDKDGASTVVSNTANVADVPITLTGALNPSSDSGVSDTDDVTNVKQPNFTGSSEPFSTITLSETPTSGGSSVVIGRGTTDSSGHWSITSDVSLADGSYVITAHAVDQAGFTMATTTIVSPLVIDTTGPQVENVFFNRLTGTLYVLYGDVGLSGVNMASIVDASNYSLTKPHTRPGEYLFNHFSLTPEANNQVLVTATINRALTIKGGIFTLTIDAATATNPSGVQDVAGNALDGEFYGYFPSGNGIPGGDFVARLDTYHHLVLPARTLIGIATPPGSPALKNVPPITLLPSGKVIPLKSPLAVNIGSHKPPGLAALPGQNAAALKAHDAALKTVKVRHAAKSVHHR